MKPRSIVGPLILIGLGTLFLLNNLRPDFAPLGWIATYWPVFLAGWGALRLVEILIWYVRGLPLPSSGVSGGEWTLAVLLCLAGSALFAIHQHGPFGRFPMLTMRGLEIFGEPRDFDIESRTVAAGRTPRIVIENLRGDLRVAGADTDRIELRGRKNIRAFDAQAAEATDRATPVEVVEQGERILIRTNQERAPAEQRLRTNLDLTVPRGATLEVRGRSGTFDVMAIDGQLDLVSDSANVRAEDLGGPVRLSLRGGDWIDLVKVRGNVTIEGRGDDLALEDVQGKVEISGSYSGDLRFRNLRSSLRFRGDRTTLELEAVPGELSFDLGSLDGSGITGPFRLKTRSKDVRLEEVTGAIQIELDRGDVGLRPAAPALSEISVKAEAGELQLALPEKAEFQLSARVDRGNIENEFGERLIVRREGRGATLESPAGKGPRITLEVGRGAIQVGPDSGSLWRRSRAPRVPSPPRPPRLPRLPELGHEPPPPPERF